MLLSPAAVAHLWRQSWRTRPLAVLLGFFQAATWTVIVYIGGVFVVSFFALCFSGDVWGVIFGVSVAALICGFAGAVVGSKLPDGSRWQNGFLFGGIGLMVLCPLGIVTAMMGSGWLFHLIGELGSHHSSAGGLGGESPAACGGGEELAYPC